MSLVSIIVPVYNAQDHLARCIDSLIGQTLKDIEIILVNDGSTDGSPKICDQYKVKDSRVRVIHQKNTGQGIARNAGIKQAKSSYIGFVDADDWAEEDMFEKLYQTSHNEGADITMCNCFEIINGIPEKTYIKATTSTLNHKQILEQIILPMVGGITIQEHYENNIPGYVWRCLYKKELIQDNPFISEREIMFEDLWFNIQAMYGSKKIIIRPEHLYNYFHHNESYVRTYKKDIWNIKKKLNKLIEDFFRLHKIENLIEQRMYNRQAINLLESINNEMYDQNKKTSKQQKQSIKAMCQEPQMQKAVDRAKWGDIPKFHKLRLYLIKNQQFHMLYYIVKGAYAFKQIRS